MVKAFRGLSDDVRPSGVVGPEPELFRYEGEADLLEQLDRIVEQLVSNAVQPSDIVILSTRGPERFGLRYGEKIGPFRIVEVPELGTDLLTMTVHKFKGLESPVVILCVSEDTSGKTDDLVYIGMTRATGHLIVLAEGAIHGRLKSAGFVTR